jgi:hypothetical protein
MVLTCSRISNVTNFARENSESYAQTLHESGIPQACIRIAERIFVLGEARGTARLVTVGQENGRSTIPPSKWSSIAESKFLLDTQDLEPSAGFTVHKVLPLDLNRNDGAGSGRESADRRKKANVSLQIILSIPIKVLNSARTI